MIKIEKLWNFFRKHGSSFFLLLFHTNVGKAICRENHPLSKRPHALSLSHPLSLLHSPTHTHSSTHAHQGLSSHFATRNRNPTNSEPVPESRERQQPMRKPPSQWGQVGMNKKRKTENDRRTPASLHRQEQLHAPRSHPLQPPRPHQREAQVWGGEGGKRCFAHFFSFRLFFTSEWDLLDLEVVQLPNQPSISQHWTKKQLRQRIFWN